MKTMIVLTILLVAGSAIAAGPQYFQCPANEMLQPTPPCCEPTCDCDCTNVVCKQLLVYQPTCVCVDGYVRFEGQCVPQSCCPTTPPPCETTTPPCETTPAPVCYRCEETPCGCGQAQYPPAPMVQYETAPPPCETPAPPCAYPQPVAVYPPAPSCGCGQTPCSCGQPDQPYYPPPCETTTPPCETTTPPCAYPPAPSCGCGQSVCSCGQPAQPYYPVPCETAPPPCETTTTPPCETTTTPPCETTTAPPPCETPAPPACSPCEELVYTRPCCEPTCDNNCSGVSCPLLLVEEPTCACRPGLVRFQGHCVEPTSCPRSASRYRLYVPKTASCACNRDVVVLGTRF